MSSRRIGARAGALTLGLALACMPEIVRTKVDFTPAAEQPTVVVAAPVRVASTKGFQETVPAGSTWRRVGSVPQGDVYKPVGTVFMLTSANAHEAYLVVADGRVTGFYLPGEGAFAPAAEATALPLQ